MSTEFEGRQGYVSSDDLTREDVWIVPSIGSHPALQIRFGAEDHVYVKAGSLLGTNYAWEYLASNIRDADVEPLRDWLGERLEAINDALEAGAVALIREPSPQRRASIAKELGVLHTRDTHLRPFFEFLSDLPF